MNAMPNNTGNTQNNGIASLMQGQGQPMTGAPTPTPQQNQTGQQPAQILPDLKQALAAQEALKLKQAAINNDALGQQPQTKTVVQQNQEKLQMLQQQEEQRKQQELMAMLAPLLQRLQGQDTERPRGDITQLASNLGDDDSYADGGIVAFSGGDKVEGKKVDIEALLDQIPTERGSTNEVGGGDSASSSEFDRNVSNTLNALPGASVTKATTIPRMALAALAQLINRNTSGKSEEGMASPTAEGVRKHQVGDAGKTPVRDYASPTAEGVRKHQVGNAGITAIAPAGTGNGASPGIGAGSASGSQKIAGRVAPKSESDIEGILKGILGKNEVNERDGTNKWYKDQLGLDAYAARDEARIKAIEDTQAEQDKGSNWRIAAKALAKGATSNPLLGLAGVGGAFAESGIAGMEARDAANITFQKDMAVQRRAYEKAVMDGNKQAADHALKTMEELRNQKERAAQGLVNLENVRATRESTERVANTAAAGRALSASQHRDTLNLAKEAARVDAQKRDAMRFAEANAKNKIDGIIKQNESLGRKEKIPLPDLDQLTYTLYLQKLDRLQNGENAKAPEKAPAPATLGSVAKYKEAGFSIGK